MIPPQPDDWPSPNRIDILFALASAVESRTTTHRRLRQFLELPRGAKVTESLLLECMSWTEYVIIMAGYAEQVCALGVGRMDADA
jgi:hypothetical protein